MKIPKNPKIPVRLKRVAYHEAGHAVMATLKGRRIRWVTIIPEDDGFLGCCALYSRALRTFNDHEKTVRVHLAGLAAEAILTGHKYLQNTRGMHFHFQKDSSLPWKYAIWLMRNEREASKLIDQMYWGVISLLKCKENWRAVKQIAEELLDKKKIRGRSAERIVKESIKGTPSSMIW